MRYLLDTHIWIWSLLEPDRLARHVAKELQNPENELFLSPISVWELLMLSRKGRIVLDEDAGAWIAKAFRAAPLHEAPLTHEVALATRHIELPHRDPADKFLAATARVLGLTLITADPQLAALRGLPVLTNR